MKLTLKVFFIIEFIIINYFKTFSTVQLFLLNWDVNDYKKLSYFKGVQEWLILFVNPVLGHVILHV